MLKADEIAIYFLEQDEKTLTPVVALKQNRKGGIVLTTQNVKASFIGQVVHSRKTLVYNNFKNKVSTQKILDIPEEKDVHIIATPIIINNKVVGVMRISFSSETSSSEDLELIETFAEYAATTIKSANIYDDFQREVEEHKATEGKLRNMQKKLEIRVKGQTGKLSEINKKMKSEIDRYKQTEKELKDNFKKLKSVFEGVVNAMSMIVEARDPYTAGHQRRVSRLACAIAKEMGFSEENTERIRIAGLLHDIGKITIPGEILIKPGVLNKSEFEIIKNHPQVGYDILKGIDFPWHISEIVLQHHERLDGSGYPVGLSNKDILLEAKILAVADVVEAVSSHRPYRPSRGINKALRIITENKNILYDTAVVDACLHLFYESRFKFE